MQVDAGESGEEGCGEVEALPQVRQLIAKTRWFERVLIEAPE
jgi:hypothetical protein